MNLVIFAKISNINNLIWHSGQDYSTRAARVKRGIDFSSRRAIMELSIWLTSFDVQIVGGISDDRLALADNDSKLCREIKACSHPA